MTKFNRILMMAAAFWMAAHSTAFAEGFKNGDCFICPSAGLHLEVQRDNSIVGRPMHLWDFNNGGEGQRWFPESANSTLGSIPVRVYNTSNQLVAEDELYNIIFKFYQGGQEVKSRNFWIKVVAPGQISIENVPPGTYTLKAFLIIDRGGRGDNLVPSDEIPLSPDEHTVTVPVGGAASEVEFRFKQ